jgi:hypothetical protein
LSFPHSAFIENTFADAENAAPGRFDAEVFFTSMQGGAIASYGAGRTTFYRPRHPLTWPQQHPHFAGNDIAVYFSDRANGDQRFDKNQPDLINLSVARTGPETFLVSMFLKSWNVHATPFEAELVGDLLVGLGDQIGPGRFSGEEYGALYSFTFLVGDFDLSLPPAGG